MAFECGRKEGGGGRRQRTSRKSLGNERWRYLRTGPRSNILEDVIRLVYVTAIIGESSACTDRLDFSTAAHRRLSVPTSQSPLCTPSYMESLIIF